MIEKITSKVNVQMLKWSQKISVLNNYDLKITLIETIS